MALLWQTRAIETGNPNISILVVKNRLTGISSVRIDETCNGDERIVSQLQFRQKNDSSLDPKDLKGKIQSYDGSVLIDSRDETPDEVRQVLTKFGVFPSRPHVT